MLRPAAAPRPLRRLLVPVLLAVLGRTVGAAVVHPQDGPHGDLRIVLAERSLRFEVGLNLAFLDEVVDAPRERTDEVDETIEWPRLRDAVEELLRDRVVLAIDGARAAPTIEETTLLRPDPALLPLFPRSGMRGLLRVHTTLVYPVDGEPDEVAITWPAFATDALSAELEGGAGSTMVLQVLFNAFGTVDVLELSAVRPTATWRNDHLTPMDRMVTVPDPRGDAAPPAGRPLAWALGAIAAGGALAIVLRRRPALAGAAFLVGAIGGAALAMRPGGSPPPPADDAARLATFRALHANLYTAFDYTAERDIYDALAASVDGPLLETLYQRIYQSLILTDHEQALGRIIGIGDLECAVRHDEADHADGDPDAPFVVDAGWRVDGAVHHWGHAHTRAYAYRARFTIARREPGWRIVAQEILEQTRIPTAGDPLDTGLPPPGTEI